MLIEVLGVLLQKWYGGVGSGGGGVIPVSVGAPES